MTTLLLRLAGPLQSWGESARFARRTTERTPTKSGVLGLLAAATGRRRVDPIEDLLTLRFGVRVDQPGRIERDFQTSVGADGSRFPLTNRYYLTDAVFLAAIEGDRELVQGLDEALRAPAFPLYLGRRSCPPQGRLSLGTRDSGLWEALSAEPWQAANWWKRRSGLTVLLEAHVDDGVVPAHVGGTLTRTTHRDVPLSFDPERREYGWREVGHRQVPIINDDPAPDRTPRPSHDPLSAFGGAF